MLTRLQIEALFQNESDVFHQFFHRYHSKSPVEPEKTLMLAVLEDAILCFLQEAPGREVTKRRDAEEAEEWIFEKNSDWPFSFESVCEVLGLSPVSVRKRLLREKKKKRRRLCG